SVSVKSEQDVGITGGDTVCLDATLALDATVAGGTWSSADETVATVDANGIVTGVGVGTVAIFYTLPGDPDYCETVTEINVQVNPTPTVDAITDVVVCADEVVGAITFDGPVAGTTYSWTNSHPSIGLAESGTGSLPSFHPINTGTAPIIATITVTPTANGCPGDAVTFTITVNPLPIITAQPVDLALCEGETGAFSIGATGQGLTYQWEATFDGNSWVPLHDDTHPRVHPEGATLRVSDALTAFDEVQVRVTVTNERDRKSVV